MEKINIKSGKNYRMINKETKQVHVLNAQEVANFVFRNSYDNYKIEEIICLNYCEHVPTHTIKLLTP